MYPIYGTQKVFDIINYLKTKKINVQVFDHMVVENISLKNILIKKIKKIILML